MGSLEERVDLQVTLNLWIKDVGFEAWNISIFDCIDISDINIASKKQSKI